MTVKGARRGSPSRLPAQPPPVPQTLVFEVPLPPTGCSPNGQHGSAFEKARARSSYRETVRYEALNALRRARWRKPAAVRVSLEFATGRSPVWPDGLYRPKDPGNAVSAAKALLDGLVDAGVVDDDDWAHMVLWRVQKRPGGPAVTVRIEEIVD